MSQTPNGARPFYWSVRRELWEARSILVAPLATGGLVLLGFLISTIGLPGRRLQTLALDPLHQLKAIGEPYVVTGEVLTGVMRIEKQLDLSITAANIQKQIESANEKSRSEGFEFVSKGWRSPITFVVLDNMDTKSIFEFQGLSGWKLVRDESSKEGLRKILDREIGPRGK